LPTEAWQGASDCTCRRLGRASMRYAKLNASAPAGSP